ncbi:TolC family protein [Flectobacillus roseus]|uniref:TolC family protein n=1 Tax=Flectobacillus roseus TaxID=502259 RepID=A0ABT6Y808_9BACT|nr:TolC family protein [Flectobacillus roseus]MDI9859391.1 TolC family protein [Flectobacillus roseus]
MKLNIKSKILLLLVLLMNAFGLKAQSKQAYSLQQLIESAMKTNQLLTIKDWQILEKKSKLREDNIRKYPAASLDGNYQYNFKLAELSIPAGVLGSVTTNTGTEQLLPQESSKFTLGERHTYGMGLSVYQPISQQGKIKTGLDLNRLDIRLTEKEKLKASQQLRLSIKKLYYGVLIVQKKTEESKAKLALAKAKLYDAEGALNAGKIISTSIAGLQASIAEEEQNSMKLTMQVQDYLSDLSYLSNIKTDSLIINDTVLRSESLKVLDEYKADAAANPDLQIAEITKEKALLGVKAVQQSNIPDVGAVAGYSYQYGNPILPTVNFFVGLNLKWNLQDLFTNKEVMNQRTFQVKQAEENISYLKNQLNSEVEKAWRKVNQSKILIGVAQKVVKYRNNALKEQQDKSASGMNINTEMLEAQAQLAQAEADLYAADLSYLVAVAELNNLIGK